MQVYSFLYFHLSSCINLKWKSFDSTTATFPLFKLNVQHTTNEHHETEWLFSPLLGPFLGLHYLSAIAGEGYSLTQTCTLSSGTGLWWWVSLLYWWSPFGQIDGTQSEPSKSQQALSRPLTVNLPKANSIWAKTSISVSGEAVHVDEAVPSELIRIIIKH